MQFSSHEEVPVHDEVSDGDREGTQHQQDTNPHGGLASRGGLGHQGETGVLPHEHRTQRAVDPDFRSLLEVVAVQTSNHLLGLVNEKRTGVIPPR